MLKVLNKLCRMEYFVTYVSQVALSFSSFFSILEEVWEDVMLYDVLKLPTLSGHFFF